MEGQTHSLNFYVTSLFTHTSEVFIGNYF